MKPAQPPFRWTEIATTANPSRHCTLEYESNHLSLIVWLQSGGYAWSGRWYRSHDITPAYQGQGRDIRDMEAAMREAEAWAQGRIDGSRPMPPGQSGSP